jgi:cellulose biosynthesis protein BcsQ
MAKIITFYSYTKNSGKTTIAFNMAYLLAYKKKKVLIVELQFNSSYFKYLELKNSNLKTQNILKRFSYFELNENLSIAMLNQSIDGKHE